MIFYISFIHSFIQGLLSLIDWLIGVGASMLELTKPMDKASESVNPSFSSMEDPEIV